MQTCKWLKTLALAVCAATLWLPGFAADNIPQSAKALYKEVPSLLDICRNPAKFAPKDECKLKFKIVFKAKADTLPPKYEDAFAKNNALIVPEGDVQEGFTKIPIIYSTARSKLRDEITNLELNKPVILYATLRFKMFKDSKRKDAEQEKLFALFVDDIEIPELTVRDLVDITKDAEFAPAKSKRLDLQYERYLGRKVSVAFHFKDTDNKISADIAKLTDIGNETHFTIIPTEVFHTAIVAERNNEKCVEPLIDMLPGDLMTLNGVLRKADDPTSQKHIPVYYFYVYSIAAGATAQKSVEEPRPAPQVQTPAPAPEPAAPPVPAPAKEPEPKPAPQAPPPQSQSGSPSPLDDWKGILQEQAK